MEWNHDHVHVLVLFRAHPKSEISKFINACKSTCGRLIKKVFPSIKTKQWKEYFRSQSFCLITAGGVPLSVIKQSIESQGGKQSRQITNAYDAVVVENLNMKEMYEALRFGKSVHDNGWGRFIRFLQYKLTEAGKQLVKVDKWFPSSKTCCGCGKKKDELALSERVYLCECGNIMDRDQNAAINIRQEGLRVLGIA